MQIETKSDAVQEHRRGVTAHRCSVLLLMIGAFVFVDVNAVAQEAGQQAPPSSPSVGTMGGFGHWFWQGGQWMQQGVANMQQGVATMQKGAATVEQGAVDAARNAATSVSKLPHTTVTAGHEPCVVAPNGAPDCHRAALMLCRAKGYGSGTSVDFVTIENCPPEWRTVRRDDIPEGACPTEHYVTKALCQ